MRRALVVLALAGCNQLLGISDPHLQDGGVTSPGGDGGTIADCVGAQFGYPISNVASCDIPQPAGPLSLGSGTIDTTAGTISQGSAAAMPLPATALMAQPNGPQLRVVSASGLTIAAGATLNVVGQFGLVIVVTGDVTVAGVLSASANRATAAAGSRTAAACGSSAGQLGMPMSANSDLFSAGSGGGGFGGVGGLGGESLTPGGTLLKGGAGGVIGGSPMLTPLLGGCPGGVRAVDPPAAGGGAIQISASGAIDVSGAIAAGGGGGAYVTTLVSAEGGGSGGGVLLEARSVTVQAQGAITANGGGGANSLPSSSTADTAPCNGANANINSAAPAAGGDCGSDIIGGAGGAGDKVAGGGDDSAQGTGGGGGVGRIAVHANAFTSAGIVSPTAQREAF